MRLFSLSIWCKVLLDGTWKITAVKITNRLQLGSRLDGADVYIDDEKCASNIKIGGGETMAISCVGTGSRIEIRLGTGQPLTICGFAARGSRTGTPVEWTGTFGVSASANGGLVKVSGGNSWNAGGHSKNSHSGDVQLDFTCTVAQYTMVGFSNNGGSHSYTDIACGFYCCNGDLQGYEQGVLKWKDQTTYTDSDRLALTRTRSTVTFWKGDTLLYTCSISLSGGIVADATIYNQEQGGILSASWVHKTGVDLMAGVRVRVRVRVGVRVRVRVTVNSHLP